MGEHTHTESDIGKKKQKKTEGKVVTSLVAVVRTNIQDTFQTAPSYNWTAC